MSLFKNKKLWIAIVLIALVLMLLTGDESMAEGKLRSLPLDAEAGRLARPECYLPDNAGYEDEIVYLLNRGAKTDIKDNNGKMAVDYFRGEIPAGLKDTFK